MEASLHHQYIIAIGTSAGGVEALESLFDHTSPDGVSYIIIQHLSPDYQSRLAQVLAKHSKLEICEAENTMRVEVNKVYVIPNNKYMTIDKGRLQLKDKPKTNTPHLTINTFFHSLAAERGNKAIGIILTGLGTDGTLGIEAIHKAGGIVMVQDPVTAKYDDMPNSAISTGFATMVLAPWAMPKAIEEYINKTATGFKEAIQGDVHEELKQEMDESILLAIFEIIKGQLPLDFSGYKRGTITRRIARRMTCTHTSSPEAYFIYLQKNPLEIELLAQDFLIHVTAFFRDKEEFEHLETAIIPAVIDHQIPGNTLKIWCAGCATGEEAYSLAILIKEYVDKTKSDLEVKIFATDIDKKVISIASQGVYPESIAKNISEERLKKFFIREENTYKVKPDIRKMLIFAQHDLAKNPPYCNMDLISCRNVLIYMSPVLQKKVFSMLNFGLKQGGYLFLGSSENAQLLSTCFSEVNKKWKVYQKITSSLEASFDTFSPPIIEDLKLFSLPYIQSVESSHLKINLAEEVNESVMHETGYAGVCLDKNLTVIQTFGDLSPYLLPKVFNFNLVDLLPKSLSGVFGAAFHRALKYNQRVVIKRIQIKEDRPDLINVLIEPFVVRKNAQKLILVLFSDNAKNKKKKDSKGRELFNYSNSTSEYIKDLELELKEARENLQLAFEKIESFNENMQSFNEELLSANEEMQSANEELQSVNEELQTINIEHQQKIKELTELNDDLNNYFRSNVSGQLFVDKGLLLKKFSPAVTSLINLREIDLGRPIDDITTFFNSESLVEDLHKVIATGEIIIKELQATNKKWYQVLTMPYIRQTDSKVDGAIITFNEITNLKHTQEELDYSNESLKRINADLDNFVYAASHDLLGPLSSIEGLINLLRTNKDTSDVKLTEYNNMLDYSIDKFKTSVKELASIGRIESEMLGEPVSINIEELLSDIKLSILDKITSSHASIVEKLEVREIKFSKKNLRSILYNLISNAIKFTSPERNPQIVISTQAKDGFVQLTVSDNGIGMADDKISSVFTMYRRLNMHIEGQGLGLYLVKKIVDAAGGKIEIQSELNKGTSFTIFFRV